MFSRWIVYIYIFSRWTIFLTKVARSTSRRSLAGFRWVIATDWGGYNSRRDQMDSDGFRWGLMGDCHWLSRIQFKKGPDGFRWIQMGSDGWLPLTEEDTIQEENFHMSSLFLIVKVQIIWRFRAWHLHPPIHPCILHLSFEDLMVSLVSRSSHKKNMNHL